MVHIGRKMIAIQVDGQGFSAALAGAGKMGGALLRGWLARGYDPSLIYVIEPDPSDEVLVLARDNGFALGPPSQPPEVLVLAMKPQSLDGAAAELAPLLETNTLVISILAGKTSGDIAARLPPARAIIRAMPNLPASLGRGITALAANSAVSPAQRMAAEALFSAVGRIEWLAGEHLIDAATALSGNGPAYVFYFTEALARAGEALGLPAETAARLARATVEGAGELMFQNPAVPVADLRASVTSPGGTTAAALEVLMATDGLAPLIEKVLQAAMRRAAALAG